VSEHWLAVRVEPSGDSQTVIDALFAAGAQGVQEQGNAIVTHFPPGTDIGEIESAVRDADLNAGFSVDKAPEVDWSGWRASVVPHRLGKLTIAPPWLAAADDPFTVVIDPAMAFGTGEHATTRGVVRLMQKIERMPDTVADLGAGSAVLAICAAKLGAKRIAAVELDEDAIGNAEENVGRNNVGGAVKVIQGDAAVMLPLLAPVGLVLANIISSVLLELLPLIRESLSSDGRAILSGILVEESAMMTEAIQRNDFTMEAEDREEGWWSVMIAPRQ
jgi:ribosomal protein L11 methyltransferase